MSIKKRLRLNQVAREFKVGLGTIVEFLDKQGVKGVTSPSAIVEPDIYEVLEKEFGSNRPAGGGSIRERINLNQETVSLKDLKEEEEGPIEEPVKKSTVISVKDEVAARGPKILGTIDLSPKPKHKEEKKEEPALKPDTAKVEVEKKQPEESKVTEKKEEAPKQGKTEVKEEIIIKAETPKKEELRKERVVAVAPDKEKKESVATAIPDKGRKESVAVVPETAKKAEEIATIDPGIQEKTYDERMAADDSDVFRNPDSNKLSGPKVLGQISVDKLGNKRREKRKRITKDKVDVTKQQPQTGKGGQAGQGAQKRGPGQGAPGSQQRAKPTATQQRGGSSSAGRKVKPVVRPEVSEEDVQKQIKETLARLTSKGNRGKSAKYRRDKRDAVSARMSKEMERAEIDKGIIKVTEFVTVSELASMMDVPVTHVITACMNLGLMVSINQRLDAEALAIVVEEFGFEIEFVSVDLQEAIEGEGVTDNEEDLVSRPPIVTVMGHVDHGKTSLLDNIRKANVIEGEAGGITQHIGAYSVTLDGKKITFLDTPGHEAFTAMRARGAQVTDVAIIIVAADDSVMPQTTEAINHAVAAGVPMVFAINKVDKSAANPERIKEQLAAMNYLVEDWGGKYQSQEVSAKQGLNIDKLLEKVLLEADLLDLKANPNRKASGVVIESTLDKGRGYVSTVLVQNGTLNIGDVLLSGTHTGRVKAMFNERGKKIKSAPPATPVLVLGLNGAPQAGDSFNVMEDDRVAREAANKREQLQRMQNLRAHKHITLDEIGRRIAIGNFKELNIIVKGDVDGSIEAMTDSLIKLSKEEVQVNVIHKAVGQISESDVMLAAASEAIIVGFQVRPSATAKKIAEQEEIEIRLYSIIYDAINDIKDAIEGMLAPIMKEEIVASVEVMETWKIPKVGTVAGGLVREGKIFRNTPVRVIRDGIVIHTGKLGSLKRFKDDVKEVASGMECGLNVESFNDIRVGDFIEGYEQVEVKRD